jgi:hypothetical protein
MMRCDLSKLNDKNCKGNEGAIRKNIKHMNKDEIQFLKAILKNINIVYISKHAKEKQLINMEDVKNVIKLKKFQIIDYNYHVSSKDERIMIRTKDIYKIQDNNNKIEDCYLKIVISITTYSIVTVWANKVSEEKAKQDSLKNRYYDNFDIINKRLKF